MASGRVCCGEYPDRFPTAAVNRPDTECFDFGNIGMSCEISESRCHDFRYANCNWFERMDECNYCPVADGKDLTDLSLIENLLEDPQEISSRMAFKDLVQKIQELFSENFFDRSIDFRSESIEYEGGTRPGREIYLENLSKF